MPVNVTLRTNQIMSGMLKVFPHLLADQKMRYGILQAIYDAYVTGANDQRGGHKWVHQWKFDLPWHMGHLKDWFYMVNVGHFAGTVFLHVRILGVRSLWEVEDAL